MPLRWQEVAMPLLMIVVLIALKHIPIAEEWPLARTAGVVAFGSAAFLALRLVQSEEPVQADGWSELRPSMVEYFAVYGAAALAAALMLAIIIGGFKAVNPAEMVAAFIASMALAGGAVALGLMGLFVKIRWNHAQLEYCDAFGRKTIVKWAEVRSVHPSWRGVNISTNAKSITFSQFHSGAAHLAKHATNRARRNTETASKAFAGR
ncbi:hypothetical protein PSQ90_15280 [Devosia rhodophyticola]|uniref:PH domain-containing protein n=1 Tax=Devosia rhodophyticola TaxID=3026423 RepID=A0ABY7YXT5_9HYPH|nr:hypothetical protein [Devosia rhodophyticola]WDR05610.1 hypothetical protein PSQ90_15280 [Devosia rhodophyticola]